MGRGSSSGVAAGPAGRRPSLSKGRSASVATPLASSLEPLGSAGPALGSRWLVHPPSPVRRVHLCATGSAADATSAVWIGLVVNPPQAGTSTLQSRSAHRPPGYWCPSPLRANVAVMPHRRHGPRRTPLRRARPTPASGSARRSDPPHAPVAPSAKANRVPPAGNQHARRQRGSNEGTCPLPPHDQPLVLELGVGLHHRVGVDGQRIDDLPERRKPPRDSTGPV